MPTKSNMDHNPTTPCTKNNNQSMTNVIYVMKENAKQVKTLLEQPQFNLLDKQFRLTQADPISFESSSFSSLSSSLVIINEDVDIKSCIAIPILQDYESILLQYYSKSNNDNNNKNTNELEWMKYVFKYGCQSCLYSSSTLGNHHHHHQKKENKTILECILLDTILSFHHNHTHTNNNNDNNDKDKIEKDIQQLVSLDSTICPPKLEIIGDDRTVVLPLKALNENFNESLRQLLDRYIIYNDDNNDDGNNEKKRNEFHSLLWSNIGKYYNSSRVVRRGEIDPNSKIRHSGHYILWIKGCSSSNSVDMDKTLTTDDGPSSQGWITITEQGIKQSFDLTKVMFSRGNISEKIRFGKLVHENEIILDMYAGIGYYTLPALIHGKAKFVYACEWNPDAIIALRYNLIQNGVDDRAIIVEGDSRLRLKEREFCDVVFDRISLGLLPSSEGGWRMAVRMLNKDKGGWLHIHGNVPVNERKQWCLWVCHTLFTLYQETNNNDDNSFDQPFVICHHLERVKSFAPKVDHLVADIFIGKVLPFEFDTVLEIIGEHKIGVIDSNGQFLPFLGTIDVPSCALSAGILNQDWMKDNNIS